MQRFSKILYVNDPPDNSAVALQKAVQLARTNQAQLTIIGLGEEFPRSMSRLKKTFEDIQKDQLKKLVQQVASEGIEINTLNLLGTPFLQIIRKVIRDDYDLVIKPAEGPSGVTSMLFGSTDMHLFRKCPCPVWIIKPSQQKKISSILAAVDPDPGEKTNAELNKMILELASSLARREKSTLHIVHAWNMSYEAMLRSGRARIPESEVDEMLADTRKVHQQWLDDLLDGYDFADLSVKIHLQKGTPGEEIADLANQEQVELIVMGTLARTGIPGFFIGNTAEKILEDVDCSVLAVKPRAFSTPVKA